MVPTAFMKQAEIATAVDQVKAQLWPDVQQIRWEIERNWSGQWSIYFRIILSDDAGDSRLRETATNVVWRLAERLNFLALGVTPYHNFRSVSEQAALREEAWA
jgi:hypothetical protein